MFKQILYIIIFISDSLSNHYMQTIIQIILPVSKVLYLSANLHKFPSF